VVRVEAGNGGVHYLDFCEDYRLCPFSVVVFSYDLKHVGDVWQLAGRVVNIRGEIKEYDGRAEIALEKCPSAWRWWSRAFASAQELRRGGTRTLQRREISGFEETPYAQ